MNKFFKALSVFALIAPCIVKAESFYNFPNQSRELCFFLDRGNNEYLDLKENINTIGSVTRSLANGLNAKNFPFIVSTATWYNFIKRKNYYKDYVDLKNKQQFLEKYKSELPSNMNSEQLTTILNRADDFLQISNIQFHSSEWIIRIFDNFLLFIPVNYFNTLQKTYETLRNNLEQKKSMIKGQEKKELEKNLLFFECLIPSGLSKDDVILGLKINKGKKPSNILDHKEFEGLGINIDQNFINELSNIFVTKKDFASQTEKDCLPNWYFYLLGHGDRQSIAQFSLDSFSKFLLFLNNQINTELLFYDTCEIGGPHLKEPYEEEWSYPLKTGTDLLLTLKKPLVLNYIVIASSFLYALTYTENIFFYTQQNFINFFTKIKKFVNPEPGKEIKPTLLEILDLLHPYTKNLVEQFDRLQIPVIRFPGTEWFTVVGFDKKILRLSEVFVQAKEAENKTIFIKPEIKAVILEPHKLTKPKTLPFLIYEGEAQVPIEIKSSSMPLFLFNSYEEYFSYYFKKIDASDISFEKIVNSFLSVPLALSSDNYFEIAIKTLLCKNDISKKLNFFDDKVKIENILLTFYPINKGQFSIKFNFKDKLLFAKNLKNINKLVPSLQEGTFHLIDLDSYQLRKKEATYKKIVEIIQKKQKEEIRKRKSLSELSQAFKKLSDQLTILEKQLH